MWFGMIPGGRGFANEEEEAMAATCHPSVVAAHHVIPCPAQPRCSARPGRPSPQPLAAETTRLPGARRAVPAAGARRWPRDGAGGAARRRLG